METYSHSVIRRSLCSHPFLLYWMNVQYLQRSFRTTNLSCIRTVGANFPNETKSGQIWKKLQIWKEIGEEKEELEMTIITQNAPFRLELLVTNLANNVRFVSVQSWVCYLLLLLPTSIHLQLQLELANWATLRMAKFCLPTPLPRGPPPYPPFPPPPRPQYQWFHTVVPRV